MSWFACGGCFRGKVDDSEGGTRAQSFSSVRQCACRASSEDGFEEGILPATCQFTLFQTVKCSYLIFTPSSASTGRCLLPVLLHAIFVSVLDIDWGVVRWCHVGGVHLVHWRRHLVDWLFLR